MFLLIIVVVTALAFDFTNGFHDTGNAMATSIASGALKPKVAVALSASLNLVGAFLSTAVAATIAKGLVQAGLVTLDDRIVATGAPEVVLTPELLAHVYGIDADVVHRPDGLVVVPRRLVDPTLEEMRS